MPEDAACPEYGLPLVERIGRDAVAGLLAAYLSRLCPQALSGRIDGGLQHRWRRSH